MLPMAFAFAAAEKTAQASYAIYLYCAGAAMVAGGGGYATWSYSSQPPADSSDADHATIIAVTPEEALTHQQELRECADAVHQNIVENNQTVDTRRIAQQNTIADSLRRFTQTTNQSHEATTELHAIVQRLHDVANHTELDAVSMKIETNRLLSELATTLSKLHSAQVRLVEQAEQFEHPINRLSISNNELTAQLTQANQEIRLLRALNQNAHDTIRDEEVAALKTQIIQLSTTNTALTASLGLMMQHNKPPAPIALAYSPESVVLGGNDPSTFFK